MAGPSAEEPLSSIDLAFEWVRNVLPNQLRTAEVLDGKVATLFTLATAVLTAGAAVGIKELTPTAPAAAGAGIGASVLYVLVAILAGRAFWVIRLNTLTDPGHIRREWINLAPQEFKSEMLEYVDEVYQENLTILTRKARFVKSMIILVPLEAIGVILFLAFGRLSW